MHCEEEEEALLPHVKEAGPPPHLNSQSAWIGSWHALEELYQEGKLTYIGVSNFDMRDMSTLIEIAEVTPHVLQGNIHSLVFDPQLMRFLQKHEVVFQAYNVMNAVFNARLPLLDLKRLGSYLGVDVGSLLLRWCVQQGVGAIPRASNRGHLAANTPSTVSGAPPLNKDQMDLISRAVREAFQSGESAVEEREDDQEDPANTPVTATFVNGLDSDVEVFWVHVETGEEVGPVIEALAGGGGSTSLHTHQGHSFVAKAATNRRDLGNGIHHFTVTAASGSSQHFHIGDEF
mmetsp:Transcript_50203/g.68290  ORF Transcript_50203/g.68290 Transcript_50203/m.68290 type:complete len:289 (-) Transcript_50203:286-1152(-)